MTFGATTCKELNKIKAAHQRYLAAYKQITGSLVGATQFSDFYIYKTFTTRYADPRACAPVGYR